MPIQFLKNWSIDLTKIPNYTAFKSTFSLELNVDLLDKISKSDHPEFTVERKEPLLPILAAINKTTSELEIRHSNRNGIGRFYADDNLSPIVLSRHIKHTLFTYLDWIDIDMVKGHATMLYEIAKANHIVLESFKRYIEDFDGVTKMIIRFYSLDGESELTTDEVKNLFNVLIYGGGVGGWFDRCEQHGVMFKTKEIHPFITGFKNECDNLITIVYLNNSSITNAVKGSETQEYKLKNKTMSYFCQTIENDILHIVYKVLLKRKALKPKSFALEYDGLCFKRPDASVDLDETLDEVNSTILSKTGLAVTMKWKPYSRDHVHQDIIDDLQNPPVIVEIVTEIPKEVDIVIPTTLGECETYEQFKIIFERTHFKCRSTALYYKEDRTACRDGSMELTIYTERTIRSAYRDMNHMVNVKGNLVKKYFIDQWFDDSQMRVYENMRCVPPPLICPSNVYNTWVPFTVMSLTALDKDSAGRCIIPEEDAIEIESRYDFVCNHIKAMCNHDPIAYEYLKYWIGYLLAYPAEKSSMPNIIGKPGGGKSEMLNFIISMIGESRCLVTSKPQDDVWGQFNGLIANKYLIILEELSAKQTVEYEGTIKDLITGGRLVVNTKGIQQYRIDSYLKMIALSNTITCNSTIGDRRNVMIKCSDEFVKNSSYFITLREYQADKRVQMLFYERHINLPELAMFRSKPIPITEYQRTIQNSNREDYDLFLEDWISAHQGDENVTIQSKEFYDRYSEWVKGNGSGSKAESHQKFIRNLILGLDDMVDTVANDKSLKTMRCNMIRLHVSKIRIKYGATGLKESGIEEEAV